MADSAMTIMFEGKTYDLEDFTLGELERIEVESNTPIDELSGILSALHFVAAIKRRTDPNVTLDDVRGITLRQLDEATEPESNGAAKKKRPTKQAKAPSASSADS